MIKIIRELSFHQHSNGHICVIIFCKHTVVEKYDKQSHPKTTLCHTPVLSTTDIQVGLLHSTYGHSSLHQSICYSLIYYPSNVCLSMYLFIQSSIHTSSFVQCMCSFIHSPIHLFTQSSIDPRIPLHLFNACAHSFLHSPIHQSIHSFTSICSPVYPFIHPCVHSITSLISIHLFA